MLRPVKNFLIFLGLLCLCLAAFVYWQQNRPNKYRFVDFTPKQATEQLSPSHLTYKEVNLPITSGAIKDGKWPLADDAAIYLSNSAEIGSDGNAVIYAHNWANLFGFLKNVRTGEVVRLTMSDNKHYDYVVDLIQEVTPDQTHVLSQTQDRRLTLYTCSGFFDRKRLVVVAKLTD